MDRRLGDIAALAVLLQVEVDGYEQPDGERTTVPYNAVTPGYMEMLDLFEYRSKNAV